jgi:cell division protein FtsI (penicillin-binding protein 3)
MKQRDPLSGPRRRILLIGIVLAGAVLLGRAFQLEVLNGDRWRERAEEQHGALDTLPAPRGTIYDRNGVPLAASREAFRIAVAPREVTDPRRAVQLLQSVLGMSLPDVQRSLDRRRRWVVLAGRHDMAARGQLGGVRGLYFERVMQRFYPHGTLGAELLGSVNIDGKAVAGLELQLDSVLTGRSGIAVARRDAHGKPLPGTMLDVVAPVSGQDVHLTIDADLQEIAQQALRDAVQQTDAAGGELVLADPRTGEILAAASARGASVWQWLAATEPYEPGSTAKPFFVAALLAEGVVSLQDSVYAEMGHYEHEGRMITDVEENGWLSVRDALRFSSNIAMVKLSTRIAPAAQYRYLRDFGFGTPTGVPYPGESSGVLRRPAAWSRFSQASLAIGYEISVTPLQMAMAYGAIANGGTLMEPRLVREVRSRDGRAVTEFRPRALRRVIPPQIAAQVRETLQGVVEGGTGKNAALGPYSVAGKTGTARVFRAGHYESGAYSASFAGYFPAENPQLVFLAKLDRPRGAYYGGMAAAPVTRATLEAVLAARRSPLDRAAVATRAVETNAPPASPIESGDQLAQSRPALATTPFVFVLRRGAPERASLDSSQLLVIPDVAGLPVRDAVARLHGAGFQVRVLGGGVARMTKPFAGSSAPLHHVVELDAQELAQ